MANKHPDNYCPVFGNYPKEYNRAVHGPYYPWVNYGPKTSPIKDVKLGELKTWFAARQKTPAAAAAVVSRYVSYYQLHWLNSKYGSPSKAFIHLLIGGSLLSLSLSYGYYRAERSHKYHW